MELENGAVVEDTLMRALVDCGAEAHAVARAHHNDPGSNGFTFGADRFHRAAQLSCEPLRDHGFKVTRRGAGLIARRDGLEIQFATAKPGDLHDPSNFDAGSSAARRDVAALNTYVQPSLEGLPEPPRIMHVVWSGSLEDGLTALHIGRLIEERNGQLIWAELHLVYGAIVPSSDLIMTPELALPTYLDQPEAAFTLEPRTAAISNEG
ncbi:MAG: hypothetical protein ACOH2F_03720 [Cellulomonas sp.]